jgi:hypothetical protein
MLNIDDFEFFTFSFVVLLLLAYVFLVYGTQCMSSASYSEVDSGFANGVVEWQQNLT